MSAAGKHPPRSLFHRLADRVASFDPPPLARRWLNLAGYPAFAVLVAIMTFAAAVPDERVKDRLETLLSQDPTSLQPMGLGVDVKAGEMSLSLLRRGIRAQNVVLRTRPTAPNAKPARYVLDGVKVSVGLFGLLFQRPTYDFSIEAFRGVIEGAVRVTMTDNHYRIEAHELDLGSVQGLQTALGPPLEGKLEGKVELDAPGRLLANSNGTLEITIDGASFGDGKGKLAIPGDAFMAQGVTIPKIRLGKIAATITIEKGKARIDSLVAHSADVDVTLEGYVDLRDPFPNSALHLYLRIKISDALIKKEPTLELVSNSLGAQGKRADGFIGAQITGSFASPYFQANKVPPPGVVSKHDGAGAPATPAAPAPPPGAATAVPPPAPAATDAATTPPIEIPPPAAPQPQPKDGIIPPPPSLRGVGRSNEIAKPAEEGGTPPAPTTVVPPPAPPTE